MSRSDPSIGSDLDLGWFERLYPEARARFDVKHIGGICRGGVHLATIYLHDSVGVDAKVNLDLLHAAAAALDRLSSPWVLMGDFNCTPDQLRQTGWLSLCNGTVVSPAAYTAGNRTIDFAVVSESLRHAVVGAVVLGDFTCHPHWAIRLYLRAAPRRRLV